MGKKRKKFTNEEMIAFGKLCGCEECKFCNAWENEQKVLQIIDMLEDSKRKAEEAREAISKGWLWKTN